MFQLNQAQVTSSPWIEKYRPRAMTDLISHEQIIKTLQTYMDEQNFPNIIMYGPAGTGKTSTILACAKQIYQGVFWHMVLELNASNDRGIGVVRNQIKQFAESSPPLQNSNQYLFKLIILDEADAMTKDAQAALWRMMEKYSKTTRFCLICNYISNIIPALISRCTRFKFKKIKEQEALTRLNEICQAESFQLSFEGLQQVLQISNGDMRKAINLLQSFYLQKSQLNSVEDMCRNTGHLTNKSSNEILHWIQTHDFMSAFNHINQLLKNNYIDVSTLITQLTDSVEHTRTIKDHQKMMVFICLADMENKFQVIQENDFMISYLVASLNKIFHN